MRGRTIRESFQDSGLRTPDSGHLLVPLSRVKIAARSKGSALTPKCGYEHWMATGEIRAHVDFVWDVSNLG